jgi:predicted AAA+ superfamily ATPase
MMGKKRHLAQKVDKLLQLFPAVAIIGSRQCGKSTLVKQLKPDWAYYDLERPDHYQLISSDPLGFFKRRSNNVIIDEAQQYPELFQILRGIIDQDRSTTGRFLLTGSSSPDIVKGLSESLAGRIATVEMWPFKTTEFHQLPTPEIYQQLTTSKKPADLLALQTSLTTQQVYEHWLKGGYPEPRIKSETSPEFYGLWMDEYFNDYIRRDIQRLFPKINTHKFRLLIQALAHYSGTIINHSTLAQALSVSSVTIKEYLEILHGTFIWRNLRSYEKNTLKKVQKMPKGFFRDQGILHHQLKINTIDNLLLHPVAGPSFESHIIEEIIRGLQCTLQSGVDYNYYRTRDKSEIDLIINAPFGVIPIEIKLGTKVAKRMLTALHIFIKDTQAPYGILVNNSEDIEMLSDNVIQIPARYF